MAHMIKSILVLNDISGIPANEWKDFFVNLLGKEVLQNKTQQAQPTGHIS